MSEQPIIIDTGHKPDAAVIWLHGLGADGNDFVPIVRELPLGTLSLRFIFPHAPKIPVTINNGFNMRAWYDISSADLHKVQDEAGMRKSQRLVETYLDAQIDQGISPQRVILAGFSQGGAIALLTGLRYRKPLAGIIALSTYLPLAATSKAETAAANLALPVFMGHGKRDSIVPLMAGAQSKETLLQLGHPVEWHEYPMEHSVLPQEIDDIGIWLQSRLTA